MPKLQAADPWPVVPYFIGIHFNNTTRNMAADDVEAGVEANLESDVEQFVTALVKYKLHTKKTILPKGSDRSKCIEECKKVRIIHMYIIP